jgi:DNA-binding SARP family transcriptional activator/tetratricopeptide (TPR) repeat protein
MAELTLRLLGSLDISSPRGSLVARRRQPLAVLVYLALAGATTRDQLVLLLFSECHETLARARLRRVLHELRHILRSNGVDPNLLMVRGEHVELTRSRCAIDVDAFRTAAALPLPTPEMLELYRGPLLDGFRMAEAVEFELWLLTERERLERLRLDILGRLLGAAAAGRDWSAVIALGHDLVLADPLHEATHRALMEAYAAQGRRSAVQQQYHALCEVLRRELDIEPSGETLALYRSLLGNHAAPPVSSETPLAPVRAVPFVGRERELEAMIAAARPCTTRLRVVCLQGPTGVGKTRLQAEALARLEVLGSSCAVVRVTCDEISSKVPFGALAEALRPLLTVAQNPFAHAPPSADTNAQDVPQGFGEQRFWERLVGALQAVARQQSLVFAIDDLRWADRPMLRALPYLLQRVTAGAELPELLVLLACNTDDQPDELVALLRWLSYSVANSVWLTLPSFSESEVEALVRAYGLGGHELTTLASRLHHETDGNLFFLTELLHELYQQGVPLDTGALPLPRTVRAAIAARHTRLPTIAQQVANVAAVIGRDINLDLLGSVAGLTEELLVQAVEQLEHTGFVHSHNRAYSFTHDTIRTVLYERLSSVRQRVLHRRIAHTIARAFRPQQAATLLHHARMSQQWELAFRAARTAAAHARRIAAHDDALRFEQLALDMNQALGGSRSDRFAVLLDLENDAHLLGRRDEQAATLDALDATAGDARQLAWACFRRGRFLSALARWNEAQVLLDRALAMSDESDLLGAARLQLAHCLGQQGNSRAAGELAQQVLVAATNAGDTRGRLRALVALARFAQLTDDDRQVLAWIDQAQPLAQLFADVQAELWLLRARTQLRCGQHAAMLQDAAKGYRAALTMSDVQLQADCLRQQGIAAGRLYRFAEGEACYIEARTLYQGLRNVQGEAAVTLNLAILRHRVGDFTAALGAAEAAYALATQIGDRRGQATTAVNLAAILVMLGRCDDAVHWSLVANALADELGLPVHRVLALTNRGGALLRQGVFEAARDCFVQALALRPVADVGRASDGAWLAISLLELGQLDAAQAACRTALTALAAHPGSDVPQQIHAVYALVLHRSGEQHSAQAALTQAEHALATMLKHIPNRADRHRYTRSLATNRFIRAARRGDWTSEHPLF